MYIITCTQYFAVTRSIAAAQTSRAAPDRKINEIRVALLMCECVCACACEFVYVNVFVNACVCVCVRCRALNQRWKNEKDKTRKTDQVESNNAHGFPSIPNPTVHDVDRSNERAYIKMQRSVIINI